MEQGNFPVFEQGFAGQTASNGFVGQQRFKAAGHEPGQARGKRRPIHGINGTGSTVEHQIPDGRAIKA